MKNIFSAVVIYVLVWWIVFFCTLPMGIQNIVSDKKGTMPGAPVNPGLKRKVILTTAIATVVWLVIYIIIRMNLISYHDIAQRMSM